MSSWLTTSGLLAQAETAKTEPAKGGGEAGAPPDPMGGLGSIIPMMLPIMALFYFLIIRPQQKQKAATEKLLGGLKKNDRVATIGGIIGQVVSISPEGKEVVLKVDDNTRIRFRRSAIQTVLNEGETAEDQAKPAS